MQKRASGKDIKNSNPELKRRETTSSSILESMDDQNEDDDILVGVNTMKVSDEIVENESRCWIF